MNSTFDINLFPYPIAQTYGYIPTTERSIQKTGGLGAAIHKTIMCFETVCKFCVWEMVMEYANLEEKNQELTNYLSKYLFFTKQGISSGTWVALMSNLSKVLKSQQSKLFMPEMPLLFYREKGEKITSTAKNSIGPFIWYRNRFSHPVSCPSQDMYANYNLIMKQMLIDTMNHLQFLQQYCLMAVTKQENNIILEGLLLEGPARDGDNQFKEFVGRIKLKKSQFLSPDTVVLIRRSALETCEEHPFLCYPIFLLSAFKSLQDNDATGYLPDELYIMNQVKHEKQNINSLIFTGHLQNCKPKEFSPKTQDQESERTLLQFCNIVARIGSSITTECDSQNAVLAFDESQENEINDNLVLYIERMSAQKIFDQFLISGTRCLIMTGKPGAGKSAFVASLIQSMRTNQSYFCIFHLIRPTRRNWKSIIVSLIYQIQQYSVNDLKPAIKVPDVHLDEDRKSVV